MTKIRFSLRDSYERDLIISYASNLLDIVIPRYLMPIRSKLDEIAYRLRKHTRETCGNARVVPARR